ncbi:MAG TPA: class I SAM-dependent methyltransferase [Chloroflexota bacterium]|nr:class I SAM-dependent methyltransferase [Chloroflexota bacterium]
MVGNTDAESYDAAYETRAATGQNVHGEADFVERHGPRSVLDAGCGTGRLARELARRGLETVGVDLDPRMLAVARQKALDLEWHVGDLAAINLGRTFDAVVLAGNVMIFVTPGTEAAVLTNLDRHLLPNGLLIAGFQLLPDRLGLDRYDLLAAEAGFTLAERWATWDEEPWQPGGEYAVSVHRKPAG